ncbi:hypothetical protein ACHWQZ_G018748 [Mnemiopsis leidyi]
MSWFGKKKEATPSTADAISKLQETETMLQKKSDFLEAKITQEMKTAKAAGMKNKRVALNALKRKRRYEEQLNKIDGTLCTIEFQREALENANTNTEVLRNMGYAAKALEGAHKQVGDVDKVHDLMDDIAEQQDLANEISAAISSPMGFGNDVDEDELLAELEGMEQEEMDRQFLDMPSAALPDLPSVPTSAPTKTKSTVEEDEDMAALAAWAT